jgi:hypothetical protein
MSAVGEVELLYLLAMRLLQVKQFIFAAGTRPTTNEESFVVTIESCAQEVDKTLGYWKIILIDGTPNYSYYDVVW